MGNIKLIAFDLDDTLFNTKKELTPETIETLEKAASMGIEIVPDTGRLWDAIPQNIKDLKFINYFITLNGANIIRRDGGIESIAKFEIPTEDAPCKVNSYTKFTVSPNETRMI